MTEELAPGGVEMHLGDPAEIAALRGPKKRVKTDRADARLLRTLLLQGRFPESWIPPAHVLETRTLGRLYCGLMDERRAWQQRIHAQLFHQGCPPIKALLSEAGRAALATAELSVAGRRYVDAALCRIDGLIPQIDALRTRLVSFARRQAGRRTPQRQVSWAKFCLQTHQSAGKSESKGRGRGNPWLAGTLGRIAFANSRADTFLGARYRRLARRRGKQKAIVATGNSVLTVVHHLLSNPEATSCDLGPGYYESRINKHRRPRSGHPTTGTHRPAHRDPRWQSGHHRCRRMIANPRQYTSTRLRRVRFRPAHSLSDFRVRLGAGTPTAPRLPSALVGGSL